MTRFIHSDFHVKNTKVFKQIVSQFPALDIDVYKGEVFFTDVLVDVDMVAFTDVVAKFATNGSWIKVNDVDEKKSIVFTFNGSEWCTVEIVDYDDEDEDDEFIPDDIESVMSDDGSALPDESLPKTSDTDDVWI